MITITSVMRDPNIPTIALVGTAYINDSDPSNVHYYLQRENDVLHVRGNDLINTLEVNMLTEEIEDNMVREIDVAVFNHVMFDAIYNIGLANYII